MTNELFNTMTLTEWQANVDELLKADGLTSKHIFINALSGEMKGKYNTAINSMEPDWHYWKDGWDKLNYGNYRKELENIRVIYQPKPCGEIQAIEMVA